jgi:hypothetical protein
MTCRVTSTFLKSAAKKQPFISEASRKKKGSNQKYIFFYLIIV